MGAGGFSRVGLAILDQAFFAGTTALVMVFAARLLPADSYGQLAAVYAAAILVQGAQAALLTEPAVVLVSGDFRSEANRYLCWLSEQTNRSGALLAAIFFVTGSSIGMWLDADSPVLLGTATVSLVPWVSFSHWRRVAYARGRGGASVAAAATQCVLALVGILAIGAHGWREPWAVLLALGIASFIPSVWLRASLLAKDDGTDGPDFSRDAARHRHLRYARWGVPAALARWVPDNAVYLLLPLLLGVAEAGLVRSSQNLTLPFRHVVVAMGLLVLPRLSSQAISQGRQAALQSAVRFGLGLAALNAVVAVAFLLWGKEVARLVYPTAAAEIPAMLAAGAGVSVLASLHAMLSTFQRAVEHPRAVLWTTLGNGAVTLAATPWLVARYGALGAMYAMLVGAACGTAVAALMALRLVRADVELTKGLR